MNHEDKSDFFIQKLHDILLKAWDPKNIKKKPDLEDEYDFYIEDILDVLAEETASKEQIIELLLYIERDTMKLKPNENKTILVADQIWQAFEDFLN